MADDLRTSRPPGTYDPAVNRAAGSMSGLTDEEARDFHRVFMSSFIAFTVIAIVAHVLVWNWRPWIPGTAGYPASASAPSAQVQHVASNR